MQIGVDVAPCQPLTGMYNSREGGAEVGATSEAYPRRRGQQYVGKATLAKLPIVQRLSRP